MKIRTGFISNSSSSSFVISKHFMTDEQIKEFNEFKNNLSKIDEDGYECYYYTDEDEYYICGDGDRCEYEDKLIEKLISMGIDYKKIYRGD